MWIDVTNAAGTRYGSGPIITATNWTQAAKLDAAGEFYFSMPASDPQAALLAQRRVVHCYEAVDGVATEIGAGVIAKVEVSPDAPTMLRVSGPDLLAELANRTIPSLTVCEQALTYLTENVDTGQWTGSVRWISNRYGTTFDVDLPEAHDAIVDSGGEALTLWNEGDPNIEWLYVGCDARFDYVRATISDVYLETNRAETTLIVQYFNGDGWSNVPDLVDGTSALEMGHYATMRQTGNITFTRPADWTRVEPTEQAGSWFWVRMAVSPGEATDEFVLREAAVYADVPTQDGVNQIMAYAPDTWTRTGYPETTSAKYLELAGESVLAALRALSEQGGQDVGGTPVREHFILGTGRAIEWLDAFEDSGLRAVQGIAGAEPATGTCLVTSLKRTEDTSETVTRVYPTSNDGITLHLTTRAAPAGYTLSTADGYLQHDAGAAAYGRIEAAPRWTDIQSQQSDSWYEHPAMVADAVFDRALEYLRTHGTAQEFYSLEVAGAPVTLGPGQTIRVSYHEYVDGYHAVSIDDDLYILGTRARVDADGVRLVGLEVATVDRLPETDAGMVVGAIRDSRRTAAATGNIVTQRMVETPVAGNVAITGGTIDGVSIGSNVPGAGVFTGLNVLGNIAVGGTVDGVDVSAHAADPAAHHAPVTVGNTGL
ncbi:MAG: hypothetical protein GX596_00250, partial [Propionibacterium sp.]|nr:hypothetical protein [Propionibacterium sp.]